MLTLVITNLMVKCNQTAIPAIQQFTCFTVYDCKLKFVSQLQYLGHIANDNVKDNDNIREI